MNLKQKYDILFLDFKKVICEPKLFRPNYFKIQKFLVVYNSFFNTLLNHYFEIIKDHKFIKNDTRFSSTDFFVKQSQFDIKKTDLLSDLNKVWLFIRREKTYLVDLGPDNDFCTLLIHTYDSIDLSSSEFLGEEDWNYQVSKINSLVTQRFLFILKLKEQRDFLIKNFFKLKKLSDVQYSLLITLFSLDQTLILLLLDIEFGVEMFDSLEKQKNFDIMMKPILRMQKKRYEFREELIKKRFEEICEHHEKNKKQ
jgi:hypothetical protein